MCDGCAPRPSTDTPQQAPLERAEAMHRRIGRLVALERRATRELAISLAQVQQARLHRQLGYARLGEYGEQAFGLSASKTRQLAQLGRMLPDLPTLDQAMGSGALGWTKARTLLPVLDAGNEAEWVERALTLTNRELEDQASRCIRGDQPPDRDKEYEPPRHVWTSIRMDAYHFERLMQATARSAIISETSCTMSVHAPTGAHTTLEISSRSAAPTTT